MVDVEKLRLSTLQGKLSGKHFQQRDPPPPPLPLSYFKYRHVIDMPKEYHYATEYVCCMQKFILKIHVGLY